MKRFIKLLSNLNDNAERHALSLFDEARNAFDNYSNGVQKFIDDFDFDATVNSLIRSGKNLSSSVNEMLKNVSETLNDFKVTVSFDKETEKFKYEVKDGVINIKVLGKNSYRTLSRTIPQNAIVEDLHYHVNDKNKTVTFIIPKDISKDENVRSLKEATIGRAKSAAESIREMLKKRADEIANCSSTPSSKPKKKATKKKVKFARDERGRFVKVK